MLLVIGKLVLAGILGALIGYEREAHGQAAGFRTNILVSVSGCLIMILSLGIEEIYRGVGVDSAVRIDPGRIASYALAGMGFLGAGAIIKGKGTVRGLTTAASLWLVTAIGLAIGAGLIMPAIITTLISLIILYNFRLIIRPVFTHDLHTVLILSCHCPQGMLKTIREILGRYPKVKIETVNYYQDVEKGIFTYRLRLVSKDDLPRGEIIRKLNVIDGLKEISWVEGDVP